MTPPAVRPLVVPFASARNREGTAACTLHRVDYMEVVKEAKCYARKRSIPLDFFSSLCNFDNYCFNVRSSALAQCCVLLRT